MSDHVLHFAHIASRMRAAGLPEIFIDTFADYYRQLVSGETGLIPESAIEPVTAVPNADELPPHLADTGKAALAQTAVIKLNGGLGTSMGLEQAKSLLPVKNGLTFLDIIARQTVQAGVPLLLMNSFVTEADSLAALAAYPELPRHLPLSFVQHKEPKIRVDNYEPVSWEADPELEWCPPGHGDIYSALVTSGTLSALLTAGYRYAFVSNADNLGAVMDRTILGYFAANNFPFMMEVADRTAMDRKGGHLAQRLDGQLILRESAQCPAADTAVFQDITRHRYFNTNNLWLNLEALQQLLNQRGNKLGLPMIRNKKTVDPRDPDSTPVYQLETAMGSAIGVFAGAQALRVPRTRFAPVKTTEDLFVVRSDAYVLTADNHVVPDDSATGHTPVVSLDSRYYKFVPEMDRRFPHGLPAMRQCRRLQITGDLYFGRGVTCLGEVTLTNPGDQPAMVADGAVLTGEVVFSEPASGSR